MTETFWDGDIDWYAPAEIGEQIYLKSSQRKITEEGLNKSSAKVLPVGTVLFTSRAGIGKIAIFQFFQLTLVKGDEVVESAKIGSDFLLF